MTLLIKFLGIFVACMLFASQKQANRCIFIFADKADNPNVIQQVNILKADPDGTKNRNITYQVITYSAASLQQYKKWRVPNVPFTVILIGRDNGEKLRSHQPVSLVKLFDLIDNMPMRREQVHYKL